MEQLTHSWKLSWTVKARRKLRGVMARKLCGAARQHAQTGTAGVSCAEVVEETIAPINEILERTFPKATWTVVQDLLSGFRRKENLYILLVEVFGSEQQGSYVVKIGPEDKLMKEIRGWNNCRPEGLSHDLVFLPLTVGCRPKAASKVRPKLMSLVYGDAQQFIGVETTKTFEEAALNSVLYGCPTVESVAFVLVGLYERIGQLLYTQAYPEDPARPHDTDEPDEAGVRFELDIPDLADGMKRWKTEKPLQVLREAANQTKRRGACKFVDPVDYLEYIQRYVPWKGGARLASLPAQAMSRKVPRRASFEEPKPADLVPRMLRGRAHGDLHGRNILVGIVQDRALWPTVFDYEDMSPCNLIGWDFVKLEVELKIRACGEIFRPKQQPDKVNLIPGEEGLFVGAVQDFEIDLDSQTEKFHKPSTWPPVGPEGIGPERRSPPDSGGGLPLNEPRSPSEVAPADRLRAILVQLRRMASEQLGINHRRPQDWLEEYYFLLMCYGVYVGRFPNLKSRELLSAYVASGVAAARLAWPRAHEARERKELKLAPALDI